MTAYTIRQLRGAINIVQELKALEDELTRAKDHTIQLEDSGVHVPVPESIVRAAIEARRAMLQAELDALGITVVDETPTVLASSLGMLQSQPAFWRTPSPHVPAGFKMAPHSRHQSYAAFRAAGWSDEQLIKHGHMERDERMSRAFVEAVRGMDPAAADTNKSNNFGGAPEPHDHDAATRHVVRRYSTPD